MTGQCMLKSWNHWADKEYKDGQSWIHGRSRWITSITRSIPQKDTGEFLSDDERCYKMPLIEFESLLWQDYFHTFMKTRIDWTDKSTLFSFCSLFFYFRAPQTGYTSQPGECSNYLHCWDACKYLMPLPLHLGHLWREGFYQQDTPPALRRDKKSDISPAFLYPCNLWPLEERHHKNVYITQILSQHLTIPTDPLTLTPTLTPTLTLT